MVVMWLGIFCGVLGVLGVVGFSWAIWQLNEDVFRVRTEVMDLQRKVKHLEDKDDRLEKIPFLS